MIPTLDPKISAKLHAFARRRRNLILLRGVASGLAMLLATMLLVALVDWLFVVPDSVRWGLSGLAYLAVLITEWRSCLRVLAHAPGPRRLARLVEHAEPKLREDLLSAVELGAAESGQVLDSAQFRALLQSDVAARVERLDMQRLLPVKLLRSYLAFALAILVTAAAAFLFAGAQLGTLLARAMLPMANLARVSRVQVEIVAPNPADRVVAHGDAEPLVIRLTGRRAGKAFLETFTKSGGRELIALTPAGGDRFTGAIQVAREDVQYRVRAGDAITRKYQLSSVARPVVVSFEKSILFPAYTRAGSKRTVEENGDLIALEGSEVELRLTTNQKIKDGELRIEQGKKNYTVPLVAEGDRLLGKVALTASGVYRVHLVGADSGFENKFSPEYELRAEPDLVPEVELETPRQDLILPANEIVEVRGVASDDQALEKVSQLVKINDGPWMETPLAKDCGPRAVVERRWDLFEQGVKPGDFVTMKLLAVDLKGSRGESRPLQLTITAFGFESKRLAVLEAERGLYESLRELRTAGEALEKQAHEARKDFQKLREEDPQRRQVLLGASGKLEDFEQKAAAAWTQLLATLKVAPGGHESAELVMLARCLAKMDAGAARAALDAFAADLSAKTARDRMHEIADGLVHTGQRARLAEETYRQFLACDELDVLTENMMVVSAEQERIATLARASGEDAAKWAQLASRARVVLSETASLEETMQPLAERPANQGAMQGRLKLLQKKLREQRPAVQKAMTDPAPGAGLLTPVVQFAAALSEGARTLMDLRRDVSAAPRTAFQQLTKDTGPAWAALDGLRAETERIARDKRLTPEWRDTLLDAQWEAKAAALKAHGDAEEARVSADTYFVNDVRMTTLALEGLEKSAPSLLALDKNFRVLESAHSLSELLDGLRLLSGSERWEIVAARARTGNPRDWQWLEARLRAIPGELARTQLEPERRKVIDAAQRIVAEIAGGPPFRDVEREMRERFRLERLPERTSPEIEQIASAVKSALDLLRPMMDEARNEIAAMTPKLAERMKQLAKETGKLKEETKEQAAKTEEKKPEEARADAQRQLAKQEKLNDKIDGLKDAIRADANKQDVMEAEGRERARDADDALAMLKEPPKKAAESLSEAARSDAAQVQKQALNDAGEQQQKLADALHQLAEHYENAEQGKAQDSRTALRASEEEGMKQQRDAQDAKAAELAEMAKKSPEELLAELERQLPKNPVMQQELSAVSKNTLTEAQQKLGQASNAEDAVAQDVQKMAAASPQPEQPDPQLAQAALKQPPIAQTAQETGGDVERSGRHEERLNNKPAGEQLQQLGQQIAATGERSVPSARQALDKAQTAAQAQPAVDAANDELKSEVSQLQVAANPGQQRNGEPPARATPQPDDAPPSTPQEQIWMARALDALDQALNSPPTQTADTGQKEQTPAQPPGQQPGQQPDAQQGQQPGQGQSAQQAMTQAQNALAAAAQAAAAAMRAARAGSPADQPGNDVAQNEMEAVSKNGAKADAGKNPYGAMPDARTVKSGDWGKLPKKIAEQMTQGQREAVAGEYRNQVETYYRVIAEKGRKP